MDEKFLLGCLEMLNSCKNRSIEFDSKYKKEFEYLVSKGYIYNSGNGYTITVDGERCLYEKWLEVKIEDIKRNNKLVEATENSSKAASESAESAKEANKIALSSKKMTWITIIISIAALIISLFK